MKKKLHFYVYLALSILLWVLIGMIIHFLLEMPVLYFLGSDYHKYSLGQSFSQWMGLHTFMTVIVWLASIVWGVYFGLYWYERIYLKSGKTPVFTGKTKKRTAKTKQK